MKTTIKQPLKFIAFTIPFGLIAGYLAGMYSFAGLDSLAKNSILSSTGETTFYIITAVQTALLYGGVMGFFGYILSEKVGLMRSFRFERRNTVITLICGVLCGIFMMGDYFVFANLIPILKETTYTNGAVDIVAVVTSVLYGGVIEEIMVRLFLMSLLVYILWKIFLKPSRKEAIPTWIFVVANIIAAIMFAAGHIPASIGLFGVLTPMILIRCFVVNGVAGVVFGELYRKYGIQYAMLAHIMTHIVWKLLQIIIIR